ncbi:YrhK family protein [Saccharopolyspora griseoalba]|uniref:YrhK family protein n=1 Tax=Saccharopolyspora griseoalba TaxID=1431848 RepID=A0ABW2LGA4_9PSEU
MSDPSPGESSRTVLLHIGNEELVIRQRYEVLSIVNDLLIAVWFLIGSVLFFWESTIVAGTWLFVLGSVQLMIRPLIRLHRRVKLRRVASGTPAETARDF